MLSKSLAEVLQLVPYIATRYNHEYTTLEHLLFVLLENSEIISVLRSNNVDVAALKSQVEYYINNELSSITSSADTDPRPTTALQRVIQRAAVYGNAKGHDNITVVHLLAEMFFENESYAIICLKEYGLNRVDVIKYLTSSYAVPSGLAAASDRSNDASISPVVHYLSTIDQPKNATYGKQKPDTKDVGVLDACCINLNDQARLGKIDVLIGREEEIQRTIEILCRRQKNNVILVGEPGVGKTAIAEGLALRITQGNVPNILKDFTIYALDFGSLVAGTRYRGDFEEKLKSLMFEIQNKKNIILFIDEIHNIIGGGAGASSSLDAGNMLKPALARGTIRCVGSTTFKEYRSYFEKDMALVRRFQKIVVDEPTEEGSIQILQGLKEHYEKHHNVTYSDDAIRAAVCLSERYITDRQLPDKAIDLIDEAGSRKKIQNPNSRIVSSDDIGAIIAAVAHIPLSSVLSSGAIEVKNLQQNLMSVVFGQDKAIEHLCRNIKLSAAGLQKADKPTGSYLFIGSTGVGKTELAKQLAKFCNMKLLRFDMSEYSEAHAVSRLIGSPPGYVGYEQGGLLTDAVNNFPYSVILFDEIDAAHQDVFNLLSQVIDCGRLTDSSGKNINFAHTILIMTSNASDTSKTGGIGFVEQNKSSQVIENAQERFGSEFCDRLDDIIVFKALDEHAVEKIVEQSFHDLTAQLSVKNIRIRLAQKLKKHLVKVIMESNDGGRVLHKLIDSEIKQQIADEILFGALTNGGVVNVKLSENKVQCNFENA